MILISTLIFLMQDQGLYFSLLLSATEVEKDIKIAQDLNIKREKL